MFVTTRKWLSWKKYSCQSLNLDCQEEEELDEELKAEDRLIRDIRAEVLNSDNSSKENQPSIMHIFSWLCKQKSWEHEEEMRIIIKKPSDIELKVEFDSNNIKKCCYKYFDASIVSQIILGPKCNDDQVEAVLLS